jgi:hypothetical protein
VKIAILGTGSVGRTLAEGFGGNGHEVVMGTRDPERTRTRPDAPDADLRTFAGAAAAGDVVVNATGGQVSLAALAAAGEENLAGKVLMDVSNPLDFSAGFPPTLFVKDTDSLGEQIQRAFPGARVVKTLNSMNAGLMVDPGLLPAPSAVFLSGEDPAAKEQVAGLLREFGWEQIIDLGGIATARGAEMLMPMWLQLMGVFGGPVFNWSIVR